MAITVQQVKPAIGGIVHIDGFDKDRSQLISDSTITEARAALEDRGVLVFPGLHLTDKEQLAFTDKFGDRVNFTRNVPGGEDADEADVYKITLSNNIEPEYVLGTYFWHIDGATIDQPLPKATFLSARKLAPEGGQTEFTSTFAAWDALPDDQKAAIADLKVIHRLEAAMRSVFHQLTDAQLAKYRGMATEMVHPLVWTQKSGRKSLVLGFHADEVIGMGLTDGRALLARLTEWTAQPQFRYRHEWQEGDFVIWNNHGLMHRVIPYAADSGRVMHRTTISGDQRLGHPLRELKAA